MLYYHERILGALISDSDFRLPVWDWDTDVAVPDFVGVAEDGANPLFAAGREFNKEYSTSSAEVRDSWRKLLSMPLLQYAGSYGGVQWFPGAPTATVPTLGYVIGTPHNTFHNWVGGHLFDFAGSGYDPLFYMHHCGVDRMWAHRQHLKKVTGVKEYMDLPENHPIRSRSLTFVDFERRNNGLLAPIEVKKRLGDFVGCMDLGYSYSFPNIHPARPLQRRSVYGSNSAPQWNVLSSVDTGELTIELGVQVPMNASGTLRILIDLGNRWQELGSIVMVGHGGGEEHHRDGAIGLYVTGKISGKDLRFMRKKKITTGRWVLGSRHGDAKIFEINILDLPKDSIRAGE